MFTAQFLLFSFPELLIWISFPGPVNVFSFPSSRFGNLFFKFLPDVMETTQFFYFVLVFCLFLHVWPPKDFWLPLSF